MPLHPPFSVLRLVLPLALVLLTDAAPAAADQQRLFALSRGETLNSTVDLWEGTIVDGRVVSVVRRAAVAGSLSGLFDTSKVSLAVTAGGRFVVWRQLHAVGGAEGLVVFDRLTGRMAVLDTALPLGLGVSDPAWPRLFAPYQGQIASVSPVGTVILPNTAGLLPRAISRDGRRIYAIRPEVYASGSSVGEFVVLDSTSGEFLRTVPLPEVFANVPEMVVSDDESTVWLTIDAVTGGVFNRTIRPFDMTTSSQVLAIPLPASPPQHVVSYSGLLLDDVGQRIAIAAVYRVLVNHKQIITGGEILIFDAQTGAEVERTAVEGSSSLHFDRGTRTILTFSDHENTLLPSGVPSCAPQVVRALFPESGTPPSISRTDSSTCFMVAFASPPVPPLFNAPVVTSDRSVSLSWSGPPELTNGFVLEAGSAPGLADLASFTVAGGTTTVTVPNVPTGSYYVRVRAWNDIGVGVASNEARVDVP